MKTILALAVAALVAACANPDLGPTPAASRNVISAGVGVASVLTDCGDGYQRSTPGVGGGLMLTTCLKQAAQPKAAVASGRPRPGQLPADDDPSNGFGIVSVGAGLAVTLTNCGGGKLTGVGIGMGLVVAPCPKVPVPN